MRWQCSGVDRSGCRRLRQGHRYDARTRNSRTARAQPPRAGPARTRSGGIWGPWRRTGQAVDAAAGPGRGARRRFRHPPAARLDRHRRQDRRHRQRNRHHPREIRQGRRTSLVRGRHRRQARRTHEARPDRWRLGGEAERDQFHDRQPGSAGARSGAGDRRGGARHAHRKHVARNRRTRPEGRVPEECAHHQYHARPAQQFFGRGDAGGARGRHRRQAGRAGQGHRRLRRLERPDGQRQPDGEQPHRAGTQHRRSDHRGGRGRPVAQDHGRRQGRNPAAEGNHQPDGRPAQQFLRRSDAGGTRGRGRGPARRPGGRAERGRQLERPGRQRQPAGGQSVDPGAGDRRGRDGGDPGRPGPLDPGRRARRGGRPEEQSEPDDPQPEANHRAQHRTGLAQDQPGAPDTHAAGTARHRDRRTHAAVRAGAAGRIAARSPVPDASRTRGIDRGKHAAPGADGQLRLPGAQEPVA